MTGQHKRVCFTVFDENWLPDDIDRDKIKFFVGQEEICPDTQRHHWQCYAECFKRRGWKKFEAAVGLPRGDDNKPRFHHSAAIASAEDNIAYCTKDASRMPNGERITFGDARPTRSVWDLIAIDIEKGMKLRDIKRKYVSTAGMYPTGLRDIYEVFKPVYREDAPEKWKPWQQHIVDLTATPCKDKSTIHWFWEPNGNAGKTTMSKYLYDHCGAFLVFNGKTADLAYPYDSEPIIVFNFVMANEEKVNWQPIECLKDGIIYSSKYQSCLKRFASPHVICFANFRPPNGVMGSYKWNIVDIRNYGAADSVGGGPSPPNVPFRPDTVAAVKLSDIDFDELVGTLCETSSNSNAASVVASPPPVIHFPTGSGNNSVPTAPDPVIIIRNRRRRLRRGWFSTPSARGSAPSRPVMYAGGSPSGLAADLRTSASGGLSPLTSRCAVEPG
nr:putative replication associated protein [Crucivirus sp.]